MCDRCGISPLVDEVVVDDGRVEYWLYSLYEWGGPAPSLELRFIKEAGRGADPVAL